MLAQLASAVEARDPSSRGHSERVVALSEGVALRLGWDEERLAALRVGAKLHDVGKLAVAQRILRKPGPLTEQELAFVRIHPLAGARLVSRYDAGRAAVPYALYHHERWDGEGYPTGCAGKEIPLGARLLAVVDAFDAMTSVRPYRAPLSSLEALDEIERCAGTQFDPALAAVFCEVWAEAPARAS
jgi:HD-GYP domain-containing protein (c-di-GMP phosphodiesterase class II)